MKRAVLYLRVSTVDQTTANQECELRQIAGRMGAKMAFSASRSVAARSLVDHDRSQLGRHLSHAADFLSEVGNAV